MSSYALVVHTTTKQVISRRRKNENVFKMSKDEKCTCKACKNTVFIVKYANLWGFCCGRRRGCLSSLMSVCIVKNEIPLWENIVMSSKCKLRRGWMWRSRVDVEWSKDYCSGGGWDRTNINDMYISGQKDFRNFNSPFFIFDKLSSVELRLTLVRICSWWIHLSESCKFSYLIDICCNQILPWLKKIIWVIGVLRRTVVSDWRFDNLCGSHLQSQAVVLVSWKFKNPGERFDWSVDRVAVGKCVMRLAVKTCAEIGYANT